MSASMPSLEEYQAFIYTLAVSFPPVESSTFVIRWLDEHTRWITGKVFFAHDIRLHVSEVINFSRRAIVSYGYEVYRGDERLCWYDSQPHPDDPSLASTHPHHKHIPPDIKHHRLPAPELSFSHPNIPFLIREIEELPEALIPNQKAPAPRDESQKFAVTPAVPPPLGRRMPTHFFHR